MKLPRTSRLVVAAITLFSILFMQLAVASYVCPALTIPHHQPELADGHAATEEAAPCPEPDAAQPSLCHALDQAGNQSLDKPELPALPPFLVVGFWEAATPDEAGPDSTPHTLQLSSLQHATAPPVAIRHCCFRI
jgi:hypothetical protein